MDSREVPYKVGFAGLSVERIILFLGRPGRCIASLQEAPVTSQSLWTVPAGNVRCPACADSWRLWEWVPGGHVSRCHGKGEEGESYCRHGSSGSKALQAQVPCRVWGTVLCSARCPYWGWSRARGQAERCVGSHLHTILRMQEEEEGNREMEHFRVREQHIPDSI